MSEGTISNSETARFERFRRGRESQVEYILELVRTNFENGESIAEGLIPLDDPQNLLVTRVPTRRERMAISDGDQKTKWPDPLPLWLEYVLCPRCGLEMTPLKAKAKDEWGEVITYQCHNKVSDEAFCLTVITITDGVRYFMRPGDFTSSDFDWKSVALQGIPVPVSTEDPEKSAPQAYIPDERPPTWSRNTIYKPIYDRFWDDIFASGYSLQEVLIEVCLKSRINEDPSKVRSTVSQLPTWMKAKTGYVIKSINIGGQVRLEVQGKGTGSTYEWPYSDEGYRNRHGFQ